MFLEIRPIKYHFIELYTALNKQHDDTEWHLEAEPGAAFVVELHKHLPLQMCGHTSQKAASGFIELVH